MGTKAYFFIILKNIYLKGKVTERAYICWFTSQVTTIAQARRGGSQEPGTQSVSCL